MRGDPDGPRLWLDHVSVEVPDLTVAVAHLDRSLGLRATVSPAAPERHSRVLLHRSYLEVSARPGASGWSATLFFLRFDDPTGIRAHLERAGLTYRFGKYQGVDGVWDDVEIDAPVPLPILVRRTAPASVARDWPPPLAEPHPCGASGLAQVHVGVAALGPALDAYVRLLGPEAVDPPKADPLTGRPGVVLPTASGSVVLLGEGTGRVERIVLGVGSLEVPKDQLRGRLIQREDDPVAWLDPAETFGLEVGFLAQT